MVHTDLMAKFFQTDFPLNRDGVEELLASFKIVHIPKNTLLLQEGATESTLRFINTGIIREFYSNSKKDTNINFFSSPQFITDFSSFIHDVPSKRNQESLTDLEILVLGKEKFNRLLEKYSCAKEFIGLAFQKILAQKELFEYNRITKTPEELYKELLIYKAQWLHNIPQYHIASYLGITPETLSRIRKRIY